MMTKTNSEGMTWDEWVCAAGKGVFGYLGSEGLWPYTTRGVDFRGTTKRKTYTNTHYPLKLRKAWRNGEDPTEYRATFERTPQ